MLVTVKNSVSASSRKAFSVFSKLLRNNFATQETATFEVRPFKLHKLDSGPSTTVTVSKDEAVKMYKQMSTIRRLETACGALYKEKIVRGFCHLYSGQEACCVGMKAAMRGNDAVITAYRDHGWAYVMDISVESILAELTGKKSGCSRGKGGSMHLYNEKFFGGNGIVGAQNTSTNERVFLCKVPVGAGVALAYQYLNTGGVCIALYGDGAANQGQVFEAYNMAALWKIPVIFVCENNGYGMGTSAERAAASTSYYTRGDYIPGIWIDGMDVLAVKEATKYAIDFCTSGKGPILMEVATYRYSGHSMSDPGTSYRTREEVQEVRQTRDPVTSFKEKIVNAGLSTADDLKKIDQEIRKSVDAAVAFCKADKEVGPEELTADIYSEPLESQIRGITAFESHPHMRIGRAINKQ
ncbi:hypothetical protein RUM43_015054 [Polyplax serrata]|uniref:Pyruvate dehydrogenase E1 component subunit alpha n=1 Tax=Polyplax serrata TaxID=468196 RepID=A0AAN8PG97_POLSC